MESHSVPASFTGSPDCEPCGDFWCQLSQALAVVITDHGERPDAAAVEQRRRRSPSTSFHLSPRSQAGRRAVLPLRGAAAA